MEQIESPIPMTDKTVIITGGASGVGFECATLFGLAGAKVVMVGRNTKKLEGALATLQKIGVEQVRFLSGDVGDSSFAVTVMEFTNKAFGGAPDVLVNNAGTILRKAAIDTTDEEFLAVMNTNVAGAFYFSRAVAKVMKMGSSIVNVSSTCGQVGSAGLAAYCVSKGALNQLTRAMALELAPRRITVNAVAPGAINSPMLFSKHPPGAKTDNIVDANVNSIPIGTVATPQEVARAIKYLSSEPHITGTILLVDGGYTAV